MGRDVMQGKDCSRMEDGGVSVPRRRKGNFYSSREFKVYKVSNLFLRLRLRLRLRSLLSNTRCSKC